MPRPAKKLSLDQAARKLARIVESHLATLSPEERKLRLERFSRTVARLTRKQAKRSKPVRNARSRAATRGQ